MLYLKKETLRKLFTCKGFYKGVVVPTGIEPVSEVPETSILSVVLRDQFSIVVLFIHVVITRCPDFSP